MILFAIVMSSAGSKVYQPLQSLEVPTLAFALYTLPNQIYVIALYRKAASSVWYQLLH